MTVLKVIGVLMAFAVIFLIDRPKLKAEANKKYYVIYYAILAVGLLYGMLEVFKLIPDYNKQLMLLYGKLTKKG